MAQDVSRQRINVKKNRAPLPEITVPQLRPGGLPLIGPRSQEGPRRRSPQSSSRAFSARATRSSSAFAVGLPAAPLSARNFTDLDSARDGQRGNGQGRALLSSALPRLDQGKGAVSHYSSATSWKSVNPVEPPSLAEQQLVQAARVLQKGSDPKEWLQKYGSLEETAEMTVMPSVAVTGLDLDFFHRFADALPAHRDLIKSLLAYIEVAIYPEFSGVATNAGRYLTCPKRGTGVGGLALVSALAAGGDGMLSGKVQLGGVASELHAASALLNSRAESPHYAEVLLSASASETEDEDDSSEAEEKQPVPTVEVIGANADDDESLKELMRQMHAQKPEEKPVTPALQVPAKKSVSTRIFSKELPDLSHVDVLQVNPKKSFASGKMRRNVVNAEQSFARDLPQKYKELKPNFSITRKQRWQLSRVKDKTQWVHEICSNIDGRRRAQNWLLDMLHEMTYGSIRVWCFAFWKISAIEVVTFTKQCTKLKSVHRTQIRRVLHNWRLVATGLSLNKKLQEVQDRKNEMDALHLEAENVSTTAREVAIAVDVSNGNSERSNEKLSRLKNVRQDLDGTLSVMQPELLKRVLPKLLQAWLNSFVVMVSASWLKCRSAYLSKDLTHLVLHDDETSSKVAKLPCEELLIRWVNYLLVEIKYCAADLLDSAVKDHVSDVRSAWSTKDASIFCNRCRLVRAVYLVENLGADLRDGTVLTALCAMLKAKRNGQSAFDPTDLAALDERDPDVKAATVLTCMRALAPNDKARCLLRKSDLQRGNRPVLVKFLAALFLHEAPGLQRMVAPNPNGHQSGPLTHLTKQQQIYFRRLMNRGTTEEDAVSSSDDEQEDPPMLRAFNTIEEVGGSINYDYFEDPTRLLRKEEVLADLQRVSCEDLLLRWLNCQTTDQGRGYTKNFSADLSDGYILLAVIKKVAPDIVKASGITDESFRTEQHSVEAVLECGMRCVEPFVLTEEAIHNGREDLLMSFVGTLFLARPSLTPLKGSVIWRHLKVVEKTLQHGFEVHGASQEAHGFEILRGFCREMCDERESLFEAVPKILAHCQAMDELRYRMKVFLTEFASKNKSGTLVIAGLPTAPAAGRRPDLARISILAADTISKVQASDDPESPRKRGSIGSTKRGSLVGRPLPTEPVDTYTERAQMVVRQQSRLFQEMYCYYSITLDGGSEPRLPLEGIMRIYQVCRLRCPCVCLSPHVAEATYWEVLEKDLPPWKQSNEEGGVQLVLEGLSVRGFIRWVLRIAMHRCEELSKRDHQVDFPTSLVQLAERHLKPHACQAPEDEFGRLAQENEIRGVLMAREQVLWPIFEFYSTKVEKDPHNDKLALVEEDETYEEEDLGDVMEVDALVAALQDSGQLQGKVTQEAVEHICKNVFVQAGHGSDEIISCPALQGERALTASQAWGQVRLLTKWVKLAPSKPTEATQGFQMKCRNVKRWSVRQGRGQTIDQAIKKFKGKKHRKSMVMTEPPLIAAQEETQQRPDSKQRPDANQNKSDASLEEAGMSYFEFLQALLALALYSNPNPFVAVKLRIEYFIQKLFVPGIIAYCRNKVKEGVPPVATLEDQEALFKHQDLLEQLTDRNAATEVLQFRRTLRQRAIKKTVKTERPRSADGYNKRKSIAERNTTGVPGRRMTKTTDSLRMSRASLFQP